MMKDDRADAMLMRKTVAIRDGMKNGNLNPHWVHFMLQHVVEGNHVGDLTLRPVFKSLARPRLSEIADVLSRGGRHQFGMDPKLAGLFSKMNWNDGPDRLDLTIATMDNLFLDRSEHYFETEGLIRETALGSYGLTTLPDWIVPALALDAERSTYFEVRHLNLCLTGDNEREAGFGMFYRKEWWMYLRSIDPKVHWSGPINWLLAKPS